MGGWGGLDLSALKISNPCLFQVARLNLQICLIAKKTFAELMCQRDTYRQVYIPLM